MQLITYDVDTTTPEGAKRLRHVAKICESKGVRVQNSVFELLVDQAQMLEIRHDIEAVIDIKTDSVRFYSIGNHWKNKISMIGKQNLILQGDTLML